MLGTVALALLFAAATASAAAAPSGSEAAAAQRLAATFAPITMLREQQDPPCDTGAEQYQPTSVDTVLGNPSVTLQRFVPDQGLEDLKRAPTAADIAGLDENHYLNLRGEALGDTCVYAKDFARLVRDGKAPAITYSHLAREAGHAGFVLQYWFFWYFNQFNDLHEGDWEGMQISFEADGPAAALAAAEEPSEIILFQHAGGERASWADVCWRAGAGSTTPPAAPASTSPSAT